MALRRRSSWGYLLGRCVVTAVAAASSIEAVATQASPGATGKPRIDPWPCRIVAAQTLRETFEQAWDRSKTVRGQCEELAAARAVVVLEWGASDSQSHAKTGMAVRGGVVAATVRIPPVGETIVLLAHELEHVIEKTRGLDLDREAKRPGSGVWKAVGGYETQAAIDVTRQVSSELREAREQRRKIAGKRTVPRSSRIRSLSHGRQAGPLLAHLSHPPRRTNATANVRSFDHRAPLPGPDPSGIQLCGFRLQPEGCVKRANLHDSPRLPPEGGSHTERFLSAWSRMNE